MSKKRKTEPVAEVRPPKSYLIDGVPYTEGDPLQLITPELGLITVSSDWRFRDYSTPNIVDFDLGWIKTPLACGGTVGRDGTIHNARIGLTCTRLPAIGQSNGSNDNLLRLIYFCQCRHGKHTDNFRWRVSFENGLIRADAIGWDYVNKPHNHPLVEGYENLKPEPIIHVPKPEPVPEFKPIQLHLFA